MDCLFCKIINNEITSKKIYEDDMVLAFLDIHPDSPGHTLIIPKKHFVCLEDINEEYLNHIMKISKIIKKKLEDSLKCSGITLIQNNGSIQEIKHYHLHLKPHYNNKKEINLEDVYSILNS